VSFISFGEFKLEDVRQFQEAQEAVKELYGVRADVVGGGYGCIRVTIDFSPDPTDPNAVTNTGLAFAEIMKTFCRAGFVRCVIEHPHYDAQWMSGGEQLDQKQLERVVQNIVIHAGTVKLDNYTAGQAGVMGSDGNATVGQTMTFHAPSTPQPSALQTQLGRLSDELKNLACQVREHDQAALVASLFAMACAGHDDEVSSQMVHLDTWALDVADRLRLEDLLRIFREHHPEPERFWREGRERNRPTSATGPSATEGSGA
jgi:hypothetical protein